IKPDGKVTTIGLTGSPPQKVGGFTFDAAGNYVVTDYWNHAIHIITPAGICRTLRADTAHFVKPVGIARDPATGNFIVADYTLNALYSMTPDGKTVTTLL